MYTPTTKYVPNTNLIGKIEISYDQLVNLFGQPLRTCFVEPDGYKTSVEWRITDGIDTLFIYNYKTSKLYDPDGLETNDMTDWHVGGLNEAQFIKFKEVLDNVQSN